MLIQNGEVYAPEPRGRASVLMCGRSIVRVGSVDRAALERLGVPCDVIDAAGRLVTPGFLDPHEHLLGGSGEEGFNTQTPEIRLAEIVAGGITTVVGCLGVDTTMKTMPGLLARAKALRAEGLSAFVWTGGYNVPPTTVLNTIRDDVLFIDEVLGAGEVAVADARSTDPAPRELARLANDAWVGGLLSHKAGVTHFHVGDRPERLSLLRTLLEEYHAPPQSLYPTHVGRNEALLAEAVELTRAGVSVNLDVVENDLPERLRFYLDRGGDPGRLTVSTDASLTSPGHLHEQVAACVSQHGIPLERVLPLVTTNTARVLKLPGKGRLAEGADADVLVLEAGSLDLVEVIAGGKRFVRDGRPEVVEGFERSWDRDVCTDGRRV
jgi:beta-aspartyl-dipeptidase (metallo-type)